MDEILIDEKKYISSKQAAKLTGYAKDYIGQLCREGRVPARLVGRSWYVLESAIQDHRFGPGNAESRVVTGSLAAPTELPWTKQSPRYERQIDEFTAILPPVSSKTREVPEEMPTEASEEQEASEPESLQSSWKAWFDRVGESIESVLPAQTSGQTEEITPKREEIDVRVAEETTLRIDEEGTNEDKEINIPIHTIYKSYSEEMHQNVPATDQKSEPATTINAKEQERLEANKTNKTGIVVKTLLITVAIAAVTVAALSSGIFDSYIASSGQVQQIAGIKIYTK